MWMNSTMRRKWKFAIFLYSNGPYIISIWSKIYYFHFFCRHILIGYICKLAFMCVPVHVCVCMCVFWLSLFLSASSDGWNGSSVNERCLRQIWPESLSCIALVLTELQYDYMYLLKVFFFFCHLLPDVMTKYTRQDTV